MCAKDSMSKYGPSDNRNATTHNAQYDGMEYIYSSFLYHKSSIKTLDIMHFTFDSHQPMASECEKSAISRRNLPLAVRIVELPLLYRVPSAPTVFQSRS